MIRLMGARESTPGSATHAGRFLEDFPPSVRARIAKLGLYCSIDESNGRDLINSAFFADCSAFTEDNGIDYQAVIDGNGPFVC